MADLAENARRKAQGKKSAVISPLALEAVRRIDQLFEIERAINGQSPAKRRAVRQEPSAPLVANLEAWMREQRARLARGNEVAKAMDYMLKRWTAFTRFLDDGRICLSNNAAERGVLGPLLRRSIEPVPGTKTRVAYGGKPLAASVRSPPNCRGDRSSSIPPQCLWANQDRTGLLARSTNGPS
jgi:hypothetical protein